MTYSTNYLDVSEKYVFLNRLIDGDWDSVSLALILSSENKDFIWLDSSKTAYSMGEWSIIAKPESQVLLAGADGKLQVKDYDGATVCVDGKLLDFIDDEIASFNTSNFESDFPFIGGYIGYIGYGYKSGISTRKNDSSGADAAFLKVTRFILINHLTDKAYLCSLSSKDPKEIAKNEEWINAWYTMLSNSTSKKDIQLAEDFMPASITTSVSAKQYVKDLAEVQSWLHEGESYEACYTYNIHLDFKEFEPFKAYLGLRRANPAPYSAFLNIQGRQILSTSPERFLLITRDGKIQSKPIKGTLKRTNSNEELARFENDVKTRAENLMIVDLIRNDLTKVCFPETVDVPNLMGIETYESVHQMVSTISGVLRTHSKAAIFDSLFPGGSMTGAPKLRSVDLLEQLEKEPRGVYSGVLGFFSLCGAADFSIVIRTAVVDRNNHLTIGTGGAITVLSDAKDELEETILKSSKLLEVFNTEHPFRKENND